MFPLRPKAPASSKYERDPGPRAIEGTRRGVRCKAGRPPRPPALTLRVVYPLVPRVLWLVY